MALVPIHRRVTHFWRAFFGGAFLFCAFAALVIIVYKASIPEKDAEQIRADARVQKLAALRAEDDAKLNSYRWINKDKGTVQIPIERAMELVLADLKGKAPHASGVKVENPYPAGLQDLAAPAPAPSAAAPAAKPGAKPGAKPVATPVATPAATPAAATPAPMPAATPRPRPLPTPVPPPVVIATPMPMAKPAPSRAPLWNWQSPPASKQ